MERRTPEEEQELQRIKNALEDFYIPEGETFSESKTDKRFSETSNEAQSLMGNGINFDKLEEQRFYQISFLYDPSLCVRTKEKN